MNPEEIPENDTYRLMEVQNDEFILRRMKDGTTKTIRIAPIQLESGLWKAHDKMSYSYFNFRHVFTEGTGAWIFANYNSFEPKLQHPIYPQSREELIVKLGDLLKDTDFFYYSVLPT